jgi:hypothetical protein
MKLATDASLRRERVQVDSNRITVHLPEDDIRTPEIDCPCWRLTTPLGDEQLPDHICLETMRATVHDWAAQTAEVINDLHGGAAYTVRSGTPFDEFAPGNILHAHASPPWPAYTARGHLGMVLRQWVQEAPNETLANELSDDPDWQFVLRLMLRLLNIAQNVDPEALHANPETAVEIVSPPRWFIREVAETLRRFGLPSTPRTVSHVLASLAGKREPYPSRGLLVTTLVYLRRVEDDHTGTMFRVDPTSDVVISGALEFATGPLLGETRQVALTHRNWVRDHLSGGHSLVDISTIRRAQPTRFPDSPQRPAVPDVGDRYYDYVAEALDSGHELVYLVHRHPNGSIGAINDHLTRVYQRVRKRRKDAGLPLQPPSRWRKDAHCLLSASLSRRSV